jgi:hypothetical protein
VCEYRVWAVDVWCGKGPGQIEGALLLHGTEAADGRVSVRLRRHKCVTSCARWMLTGDNVCLWRVWCEL